jgi:hypothetical protein
MSSQQILGLSGRKQAGKNTAANFVLATEMTAYNMIKHAWVIDDKGRLWVTDLLGDMEQEGMFDTTNPHPACQRFCEDRLFPLIKPYSFADILKKEICMKALGLTKEQCYGTDAQKEELTDLYWENMPGVVTNPKLAFPDTMSNPVDETVEVVSGRLGKYYEKFGVSIVYHPPGRMTAREVMQFVGTEVFRKMYGNIWVDALMRQIKQEDSLYAVICDVRFPNEVEGISAVGGRTIRFMRDPHNDQHDSETALDEENFDWNLFDAVIDNREMSVNEQNVALYNVLKEWGWAPELPQA